MRGTVLAPVVLAMMVAAAQADPSIHRAEYSDWTGLTNVIPFDDTVPLQSEGMEIMTVIFTPQRENVRVIAKFAGSGGEQDQGCVIALFKDGQAVDASMTLVGNFFYRMTPLVIDHMSEVTPGTPVTFSVNAGPRKEGTCWANGHHASRVFGGVSKSTLTVEELGVEVSNPNPPPVDTRIYPFIPEQLPRHPSFVFEGSVYMGRVDANPVAPDFMWRNHTQRPVDPDYGDHGLSDGTPKVHARSFVASDLGDSPDIVLRRAGPDNAPYNHPTAAPTEPGKSVGCYQWMSYGGRCDGKLGWKAGCENQGRISQMCAVTVGEQTGTSRAGELLLMTTPLENPGNPERRVHLTSDGMLRVLAQVNPYTVPDNLQIADPAQDGETGILGLAVRIDGQVVLKPVVVGAPGSGGMGLRALAVPN